LGPLYAIKWLKKIRFFFFFFFLGLSKQWGNKVWDFVFYVNITEGNLISELAKIKGEYDNQFLLFELIFVFCFYLFF
jgi:hypothetical protein